MFFHFPATFHVLVRWRSIYLAGVLVFVGLATGCGIREATPATSPSRSFTDGLGRVVSVSPRPQRIVSLAPNLTEILFALGLDREIAGVTSYCDYPPEAAAKEKVGDTITPNLERIVALKPDLVVVTTSSQLEALTRQLDRLGIPVFVTDPRTIREIIATIRQLGDVAGQPERAAELAEEMERRLAAVERRVRDLPRVRTLYLLQMNPLIGAGRKTFLNDLITLAGGESISGNEETDYPQFSRETVIARAPEVILFPTRHGGDSVNVEELRRVFATTPAVRFNRLSGVNPDWMDRPGPRIIEGLEQMAQALHPESP